MENNILAVVDGRNITQSDFYELLQSIGQNAQQFQSAEGQKQLVDELVMQELLYSDALAKGLDQQPEFIQALEHMTRTLLKQYAMNCLLSPVDATEEEIKAYFESHMDLFKKPETATASHILVDSEEKATEILKEIKAGLDFKDAAAKYSSCPSSAEGGSLGEFTRGRMVPEFDAVVFDMTPGEVSEPVKTQFGYHLILLDSLTPAGEAHFEDVKGQIKEQCLLAKRQALYLAKKEELSKVYSIEIK